jgi:hypothetical protein
MISDLEKDTNINCQLYLLIELIQEFVMFLQKSIGYVHHFLLVEAVGAARALWQVLLYLGHYGLCEGSALLAAVEFRFSGDKVLALTPHAHNHDQEIFHANTYA